MALSALHRASLSRCISWCPLVIITTVSPSRSSRSSISCNARATAATGDGNTSGTTMLCKQMCSSFRMCPLQHADATHVLLLPLLQAALRCCARQSR